jgi:hypothetical protein
MESCLAASDPFFSSFFFCSCSQMSEHNCERQNATGKASEGEEEEEEAGRNRLYVKERKISTTASLL